jgi:hypothetical protein
MEQQDQLVATGGDEVRAYLSAQGMTEEDIAVHLTEARGPAMTNFRFGPEEAGHVARYTLVFADGVYRLTIEPPA